MRAHEHFKLWEQELREARERTGIRGMIVAASLITVGCVLLIIMGDIALGIIGMLLAGLILTLWRLGM